MWLGEPSIVCKKCMDWRKKTTHHSLSNITPKETLAALIAQYNDQHILSKRHIIPATLEERSEEPQRCLP